MVILSSSSGAMAGPTCAQSSWPFPQPGRGKENSPEPKPLHQVHELTAGAFDQGEVRGLMPRVLDREGNEKRQVAGRLHHDPDVIALSPDLVAEHRLHQRPAFSCLSGHTAAHDGAPVFAHGTVDRDAASVGGHSPQVSAGLLHDVSAIWPGRTGTGSDTGSGSSNGNSREHERQWWRVPSVVQP